MANREIDADSSNFVTTWTVDNPPYAILKWTIENLNDADSLLKSPCFEIGETSKWHLLLDPNVVIDGDVFVGIYLKRNPSTQPVRYMLRGELSVHGPSNELIFDKMFDEIYDRDSIEFRLVKVVFPVQPSLRDTYLVRCEMVISREINSADASRSHLQKLSIDYRRLYYYNKLTDVTITAVDDIIYAHKALLHARSPFLAEKLGETITYITENNEKNPYLSVVLLFLYTGDPDLLLSSVPLEMFGKICIIAKRWQLNELVNLLTPLKMHCKTCVRNEFFEYAWEVKNSTKLRTTSSAGVLHSSEFSTRKEVNVRWRLTLEKNVQDRSEFYGLYLEKINSDNFSCKIDAEFRIYNNKGESVIKSREYIFGPRANQRCGFSSIFDKSFVQNENSIDDTLKVICFLKIHLDPESWIHFKSTSVDIYDKDRCFLKYLKVLSRNLKDLYNAQTYSDLKILAGEEIFLVHKAVLWARSPYFSSILSQFSTEHITVPVQHDIMKQILLYIYSAELPTFTLVNMQKIYEAAFCLQLRELFLICQSYILLHITVDNVLDIIVLAVKYEDKELEKASEIFACTPGNAKLFLNTRRWIIFREKHINLAIRIYHNLCSSLMVLQ